MDWFTCLKYAKIAVDVVFLVLDVMGIHLPVSSHVKSLAVQEAGKFLWMNPLARMAIKTFILALKNARNDWEIGKAVINFVWDLKACGLLWMIITSVAQKMNKWNWLMTAVQVCFSVNATLATGGWAQAAKISAVALSCKSLYDAIKDLF